MGIGVEASRFIRNDSMIVPNDFDHKVYIIYPADAMTEQAQNALLLTLEEPHSYAVFFLICQSASAMLETVRSRAPIIRTEPVPDNILSEYVRSHDSRAAALAASPSQYAAFLQEANGCIGKALALLDPEKQISGEQRHAIAQKMLKVMMRTVSEQARIELMTELPLKKRDELISVLSDICIALRDLILLKKSESAPLRFFTDREQAIDLSYQFTIVSLFELYQRINKAIEALSHNANVKLTLTALIH